MINRTMGLLLLWFASASTATTAPPPVDIDPLLAPGTYERLKISPTGAYYAATVHQPDRTVLVVIRRSDRKLTARVSGVVHSTIADFWWVNDERVVVSMAQKFGSLDQPLATGELHAVNADGSGVRLLIGNGDSDLSANAQGFDLVENYNIADLVDALPDDDHNVLISIYELGKATPWTRIERLNVYTGRHTRVTRAPVKRASFATDHAGAVRFALGANDANFSQLYYRDADKSDWTLFNDEATSGRVEVPLGFSADDKTVYLQVDQKTGPDAIVAHDLASGKRSDLLRDAVVDPYYIQPDHQQVPVAAAFMLDGLSTQYFDEQSAAAKFQRLLEKAFPDSAIATTSYTRDGLLAVIRVRSDRNPGAFFLFNRETKEAQFIFSAKEDIVPADMAETQAIALTARDGLALHGYLTLPKGATKQTALAMVLMPHGGPFGVFDDALFDADSQVLALAGYAVLRVNFRGSGNYGHAFQSAGARQWGAQMEDDLIDATRWAISQKIADPKRICIVGASYGAYAALMGVAMAPELFQCAVGYVGVYDLPKMYKADADYAKWTRAWVEEWVGPLEPLAAKSPNRLAAQIKAPIFLAAGGEDHTAPIEHSRLMERALKAADVPVETLYYDSEGHGFYTAEHRRAYSVKLLDFLSRYLGGAKAR